jgi:glycosyltransferase involved in cell wall biosynthesis
VPHCNDFGNKRLGLGSAGIPRKLRLHMSEGALPLSISIISLNEEVNLRRCLRSAAGLAREVVVVDSGSTDRTREVAEEFGATFLQQDWLGHRDQKNVALEQCTQPWVLALDCDEELSAELRASLLAFFTQPDAQRPDAAWMNRRTWFMGRWIKHGDWYPDRKLRLFRRELARWGGSPEHDKIEMRGSGSAIRLGGDLLHYSFRDTNHFLSKQAGYADVFLQRELARRATFSWFNAVTRPLWRFLRGYVLRLGFLDGFPGLWIAVATTFFTFQRYSRTYEHSAPKAP